MRKYFLVMFIFQLIFWALKPAKAEGYFNIKVKRKPASVTQVYKSADIIGDEMPQIRLSKKQLVNTVEVVRVDGR